MEHDVLEQLSSLQCGSEDLPCGSATIPALPAFLTSVLPMLRKTGRALGFLLANTGNMECAIDCFWAIVRCCLTMR